MTKEQEEQRIAQKIAKHITSNFSMKETAIFEKKLIERKIKELRKYELFAEHIYDHTEDHNNLPMDDWVMCKICNKTINQILKEYKSEVE